MGFIIVFDLSDNSEEMMCFTSILARLNQTVLGNKSIITIPDKMPIPVVITNGDISPLKIEPYSSAEKLDDFLFRNRVQIFFRACRTKEANLPLTMPSCIYAPQSEEHGDLFLSIEETKADSTWEQDQNQVASNWFNSRVIQPGLRLVNTVGYLTPKKNLAVFAGKRQDRIAVVNSDMFMPPAIEFKTPIVESTESKAVHVEPIKPAQTAMDRLKETFKSIKPSAKSIPIRPRIKLLCNWATSSGLLTGWSKMFRGTIWEKEVEWISEGQPDYWVIINKPNPEEHFDPARTIVFRMEPYIDNLPFYNDWLSGRSKSDFMFFMDHSYRNNTEWWINKTVEQLQWPIVKTRLFSTVVSGQYVMKGHKLRVDFIKYLQSHSALVVDVYGNDNPHSLKNYKGVLPVRSKENGLIPYRYHFAAENSDIQNYITEKLYDGILSECLTFYWGASNAEEHIDSRAFIRVDLENPEKALEIIESAIASDQWTKRIEFIRREKFKILNLYPVFARVPSLLKIRHLEVIQLSSSPEYIPQPIPGLMCQVRNGSRNIDCHMLRSFTNYVFPVIRAGDFTRLVNHLSIWKEVVESNKIHLILEGPVGPNFTDHLTTIMACLTTTNVEWDLISLRWGPNDTFPRDHLLVPLIPHLLAKADKIDGNPQVNPGNICSAYLLHPKGAEKLVSFITKYGFWAPLDEFIVMLYGFKQDFRSFLCWKDFADVPPEIIPGVLYYIFRSTEDGKLVNTLTPPNFPPKESRPVVLVPELKARQFMNIEKGSGKDEVKTYGC